MEAEDSASIQMFCILNMICSNVWFKKKGCQKQKISKPKVRERLLVLKDFFEQWNKFLRCDHNENWKEAVIKTIIGTHFSS